MTENLYNIEQVAEYFHVHEQTIRAWIRQGILPGFKAGKDWRFTETQVRECIANLQKRTDAKRDTGEHKAVKPSKKEDEDRELVTCGN